MIAGPERRSRIITEEEKEIIAYHEGGHAVVQRVLPKCDPVTKVTIVSRGMALGYTMSLPQEDRYLHSKTEFEDKIAGMLGGNVAEKIVFGDTTTGSSNDIEKATSLARAMVTQYGMSEKLGPLTFGRKEEMIFLGREISEQRNYSDEVAAKIDAEVREIIDRAYDRAKDALIAQREVLDRLAALLVEKETIEHEEFESLFEGVLPPRTSGPAARRIAERRTHRGRRRRGGADRRRASHQASQGPCSAARLIGAYPPRGPATSPGLVLSDSLRPMHRNGASKGGDSPTGDLRLIRPGEADYEDARRTFNATIDRHPQLIAQPATIGQVPDAVRLAHGRRPSHRDTRRGPWRCRSRGCGRSPGGRPAPSARRNGRPSGATRSRRGWCAVGGR